MLRQLKVQNYALIDEQEIFFDSGLTAITGETGSGKSILLGAFGLLLGDRAESKSIKHADRKCIVEAVFDLKGQDLVSFFELNDLDYDQHTTVRREIAPGGRGRAFINDTPVSLQVLKDLGEQLVDIHSQHENSILGERGFQFDIVDAFAKSAAVLHDYRNAFRQWQEARTELADLEANEARWKAELDFVRFQYEELEKAALNEMRQDEMEQELETLNHAEHIKSGLLQASSALNADASGVLSALAQVKPILLKLSSFHEQLAEFAQRVESCSIELRELAREMEVFESSVAFDEEKINVLQEKLNALYHLQQKHRVKTVEELIALRDQFSTQLEGGESLDERIGLLKKKIELLEAQMDSLAGELSALRKAGAQQLEASVSAHFSELSLDHAELRVELLPSSSFHAYGKEDIRFLFRANPGSPLLPVKQVASGGEISRVMLAIKASAAERKHLPVLVLDEIDQGVSGEAGNKIGVLLRKMSKHLQVITITHLPQIAGKAAHHLKVSKTSTATSTATRVQSLHADARVNELAEMLSGKALTEAALENARQLLKT